MFGVMKWTRFNSHNRLVRAAELSSHICSRWRACSVCFLLYDRLSGVIAALGPPFCLYRVLLRGGDSVKENEDQ